MEHTVKPFTVGISTWVVWCGCGLFNSIQGIQMLKYFLFKRLAFVTMYKGQNTIDVEPFVHNYCCHGKAFWFDVINAWLIFEKALVRTRTYSLLSLEGFTW